MSLFLDVIVGRKDEPIVVDGDVFVFVHKVEQTKYGQQVTLGFDAPGDVEIHRWKIYQKIMNERSGK